jgi:two-component system, NarL family, nitrate/nitrite response regulator NarL
MAQRQHFVTSDGQPHPRWVEAFGPVEVTTSAPGAAGQGEGGILWISTSLPDWEAAVSRLAAAGVRVVVLSTIPELAQGSRALSLGARGYAHTLATPELLRGIAAAVDAGGLWLGPDLMRRLVAVSSRLAALQNGGNGAASPAEDRGLLLACLTSRERQVALAVTEGKTNKEIARELGIVERTVKAHLASIFDKLEVRDRLHLALRLATAEEDSLPL